MEGLVSYNYGRSIPDEKEGTSIDKNYSVFERDVLEPIKRLVDAGEVSITRDSFHCQIESLNDNGTLANYLSNCIFDLTTGFKLGYINDDEYSRGIARVNARVKDLACDRITMTVARLDIEPDIKREDGPLAEAV